MKRLNRKQTVIVASTLFGMFFGAGNLIFPVHMGQLAGANLLPALVGFGLTAVTLPVLSVAAVGKTHSDGLFSLASKVGKKYAYFFTCLLYLTIGPFFAIPRCCAVSFTVGISPVLGGENAGIQFLFSLLFFVLVLFFSLYPKKISVWIGKLINPLFLVFLGILLASMFFQKGAYIPGTVPVGPYKDSALFQGIFEGYNTMDAIAGLAFAITVINVIRGFGVCEPAAISKDILKSGIFAGILMAVIYCLSALLGTKSLAFTEISENGGVALSEIAPYYLGQFGMILLALTVGSACLKTAIGLVTSCSNAFTEMFPGFRFGYRGFTVIFTVFSFLVSNVGLTAIIDYSVPVLMFLYPLAITLIILALSEKLFSGARPVYIGAMTGAGIAAFFDFLKTLPFSLDVSFAGKIFPFFDAGFGWVCPAAAGFLIGYIIFKRNKT